MMPHIRHRLHNVQNQHPERTIQADFCGAVVAGKRIFLRGQTGYTMHPTDRRFMGLGDAAAQAEQAMQNVRQLLEEAGARMEDLCRIKVWVIDRAYLAPVMQVVGRHLQGIPVVSSEVIIDGLARPEMLMEIDADAIRED
ncbi:MAG: Rid family hydrolase [Betaproteobacteria bacterium]